MGQGYAPAGEVRGNPAGALSPLPAEVPRIYIAGVDDEELTPFQVHVLADLHDIAKMVKEMHAELDEFRPILAMFKPGSGASDLQKAGVVRALRRGVKRG